MRTRRLGRPGRHATTAAHTRLNQWSCDLGWALWVAYEVRRRELFGSWLSWGPSCRTRTDLNFSQGDAPFPRGCIHAVQRSPATDAVVCVTERPCNRSSTEAVCERTAQQARHTHDMFAMDARSCHILGSPNFPLSGAATPVHPACGLMIRCVPRRE